MKTTRDTVPALRYECNNIYRFRSKAVKPKCSSNPEDTSGDPLNEKHGPLTPTERVSEGSIMCPLFSLEGRIAANQLKRCFL